MMSKAPAQMASQAPMQTPVTDFGIKTNKSVAPNKSETFDVMAML
jgi:hypothetical protein